MIMPVLMRLMATGFGQWGNGSKVAPVDGGLSGGSRGLRHRTRATRFRLSLRSTSVTRARGFARDIVQEVLLLPKAYELKGVGGGGKSLCEIKM